VISPVHTPRPKPGAASTAIPSAARQALLVTAERMFAERGIEGVSMRELARAAGQGNNYAVQHHFGDRAGLAKAVLEMRMTELNVIRAEFLREAKDRARGRELDLRTLVEATYLPMAAVVDEAGRHNFARFRAHVSIHFGPDPWGLIGKLASAGNEVQALMRRKLSHLSAEDYVGRLDLVTTFFLAAIASRDPGRATRSGIDDAGFLNEVITLCVACLEAPRPEHQTAASSAEPAIS